MMRNLQNIVSNFGNIIARQGNQLVVRIELLRSLRASSIYSALRSYSSALAIALGDDAWHGPVKTWFEPRTGTATCFAVAKHALVKQAQRRHQIMCHRAAA